MAEGERVTSQLYRRPYRPRAIAVANALGRGLERVGLRTSLAEESLLAAARRKSGRASFESYVWSGVIAANLLTMARHILH